MRIVILLYCVWLASAGTVPDKCDGVTFNGKYYNKEVLLTNITGVDGFSLDKSTNTLFFSYIYPEHMNITHNHFMGIAYYNINTKEFKDILEVEGGFTTAINPDTGDVYLGGNDGIYKLNSLNKTAEPYAAQGVNIYYLHYSTLLYYTTFPDNEIYSYDGKETKKVSNVQVASFIGDKEKYFFSNNTGLYRVLDDKEENAEIFSDSLIDYRMFAKDNNNNIFVTGEDAVYVPNEERKKLDKIADIKSIIDLVFDQNNNIIYSDVDSINRLTPSQANCPPNSI